MIDLFSLVKSITRGRGVNPLEYRQTLTEASRRWGASSILRNDGIGIDKVFQELSFSYPEMFDSLDEFVDALAERLGRKKSMEEQFGWERVAGTIENKDGMIIKLQKDSKLDRVGREILEEEGLVITEKGKRKVRLTEKAIGRILEMSMFEKG